MVRDSGTYILCTLWTGPEKPIPDLRVRNSHISSALICTLPETAFQFVYGFGLFSGAFAVSFRMCREGTQNFQSFPIASHSTQVPLTHTAEIVLQDSIELHSSTGFDHCRNRPTRETCDATDWIEVWRCGEFTAIHLTEFKEIAWAYDKWWICLGFY